MKEMNASSGRCKSVSTQSIGGERHVRLIQFWDAGIDGKSETQSTIVGAKVV